MQVPVAYLGRSAFVQEGATSSLSFAPNLRRDLVAFDAALRQPVRFREAMSALHDIVVSDYRFQKRDKSAYEAWKKQEKERLQRLQQTVHQQALLSEQDEILRLRATPLPEGFAEQFHASCRGYWQVRTKYSNHLLWHNPSLWRLLVPCDPIITVAPDVVFFECFSKDESSYGCLTVDRDGGFGKAENLQLGTTNVDYSWELYNHFQALRSYRETRLQVDPSGFSVSTDDQPQYREEKIDLPPGWLRGFMQLQAAMTLPQRKVTLGREAVYSLLAWLKRHKAQTSPRAIRFELLPGAAPALVLEPWEQRIVSHGTKYDGPPGEVVRVWGRQRLLVLARLLPLIDQVDVYLLGTGLPSFWVARMGELRLTLGLSGWTTNDWVRSSAVDLLAPPVRPGPDIIESAAQLIHDQQSVRRSEVASQLACSPAEALAALRHLAQAGQVIYDLHEQVFRWRQVLPQRLGEEEIGPEHPEWIGAQRLAHRRAIPNMSVEAGPNGSTLLAGRVEGCNAECLLDADRAIKRGRCVCSYFRQYSLRNGPCRHMLALRQLSLKPFEELPSTNDGWFSQLQVWGQN